MVPGAPSLRGRALAILDQRTDLISVLLAVVASITVLLFPLAGLALAGLSMALAAVTSRKAATVFMFAMAVLQCWTLNIGSSRIHLEYAGLALLLGSLLVSALYRGAFSLAIHKPTAYLMAAFLAVNLLATLLHSPNIGESLKIIIWLTFSFMVFLSFQNLVPKVLSLEQAQAWFLLAGTIVGLIGLLAFFLHEVGFPAPFMQHDPITGQESTHSTMWEANIFGSFEMSIASLSLGRWLGGRDNPAADRRYPAILVISVLSLVVSFTRAAWLGFFLAVATQFWLGRNEPKIGRQLIRAVAILGGAVGLVAVAGGASTILLRGSTILQASGGSLAFRLIRYKEALAGWRGSPILGLGTNTFGQRFFDPSRHYASDYLPSLFLQALYDSGVIGLLLLLAFFFQIGQGLWGASTKGSLAERSTTRAYMGTLLGLLLAFQATSAFWFAINWILLALMVLQVREAYRRDATRGSGLSGLEGNPNTLQP